MKDTTYVDENITAVPSILCVGKEEGSADTASDDAVAEEKQRYCTGQVCWEGAMVQTSDRPEA